MLCSDAEVKAILAFLALLATVCLPGGSLFAMDLDAFDTGIRGTMLVGPIQPGPQRAGDEAEAPLQASFLVYRSGEKVAAFESDEAGRFEISLPPGEYSIVPDKSSPIPFAQRQQKVVTVPETGFAAVTLRFDSGMR